MTDAHPTEVAMLNLDGLIEVIAALPVGEQRFVVALAGPPAGGKSTVAAAIHAALPERTAVLGLDAFHFDDAILIEREHSDRKGAPFTFDVDGYRRCLTALIEGAGTEIAVPVFDRELELSRNGAEIVSASCDVVVTEGNYLLLDTDGWSSLAALFDMTVFVEVPMGIVRERILERWHTHGFSPTEAQARFDHNDGPNAETVLQASRRADYHIETS